MRNEGGCLFCEMAKHQLHSVVIQEDDQLMATTDLYPTTPAQGVVS
jgi:diadenosine tetraphosphate (Ap4A) HIT family hydrolase